MKNDNMDTLFRITITVKVKQRWHREGKSSLSEERSDKHNHSLHQPSYDANWAHSLPHTETHQAHCEVQ